MGIVAKGRGPDPVYSLRSALEDNLYPASYVAIAVGRT
jgi:hypothetical protein